MATYVGTVERGSIIESMLSLDLKKIRICSLASKTFLAFLIKYINLFTVFYALWIYCFVSYSFTIIYFSFKRE